MSLVPSVVAGSGDLPGSYYFALKDDPGLFQTLALTSNTLSISGGNSVNLANAYTVSTSAFKLTNQTFVPAFNTTNFTGDVLSEGRVISAPPLGNGGAVLNGGLANVTVSATLGNPSVVFEKNLFPNAAIDYDGTSINLSTASITSYANTFLLNSDLEIKGSSASINFYDTSNVQKATINYAEINDKLTTTCENFVFDAGSSNLIIMDNTFGTGITVQTNGRDITLKRNDNTGTAIETTFGINPTGNVAISGSSNYNASLFMTNSNGGYAAINNDGTDILTIQPGIKPDEIRDSTNAAGNPGEYLSINGLNQLSWSATAPGTWNPTAQSDLDMNGFKIVDNTGSLNLQPLNGEVNVYGDIGTGNNPAIQFLDTTLALNGKLEFGNFGGSTSLEGNMRYFRLFTGANAIMTMIADENTGDNAIQADGGDLNLRVAPASAASIKIGDTTGSQNNTVLKVDDAATNIQFDTQVLTFNGAGLISASSGGNSGQHLVINLNGNSYKIRLENP